MRDDCVSVLKMARILRHGLAAVALLAPALRTGAFPQQEAISPKIESSACGTVDESVKETKCLGLSFQGEVTSGKGFERPIGGNLLFRLTFAVQGWTIEIIPQHSESPQSNEYVWVVTPPYRFWNPRYLDATYGISAEEAVHITPREFNFVLNEDQFKKAGDMVELAVMSRPQSDHRSQEEYQMDVDKAVATLKNFPVAKGWLWILDSRTTKPKAKDDPGSIEWIKFKVVLRVPCDFPVAEPGREFSIDGSSCGPAEKKDK